MTSKKAPLATTPAMIADFARAEGWDTVLDLDFDAQAVGATDVPDIHTWREMLYEAQDILDAEAAAEIEVTHTMPDGWHMRLATRRGSVVYGDDGSWEDALPQHEAADVLDESIPAERAARHWSWEFAELYTHTAELIRLFRAEVRRSRS
jgi:hypothetical protein